MHITQADTIIYRSGQSDGARCPMKDRCCPNTPIRKIACAYKDSALPTTNSRWLLLFIIYGA